MIVRTLECPNCGGTVEIKHERTINAVCIQCLSILDATTPALRILQQFEGSQRFQPVIPLGTRGKLSSGRYETIGFQVRSITVDGVDYRWSEYLLYNPYKGYRYLTEYQGHWNDIRTLRALPVRTTKGGKPAVLYAGNTYKHFQAARAETVFVMGEFPWQIRFDETFGVMDYVDPPRSISSEESADEIVWSIGEYTPGPEIWKAFGLSGQPPAAIGVYSNQPSPLQDKVKSAWKMFGIFAVLIIVLMILVAIAAPDQTVFRQHYTFNNYTPGAEPSFVTPIFELKGGKSPVDVEIKTDLNNDWAYFALALINDDTGVAYDFGKEISYYYGRDSDGSWSEGERGGSATVTGVPPGRYYLRVEPEIDKDSLHKVEYDLSVVRGRPAYFWFIFAFVGILIPPIVISIRSAAFEGQRWAESDYAPESSSGGDDDD